METITIGRHRLTYSVSYSRRRTVRVRVASAEHLEISAPLRLPAATLEALLQAKAAWLEDQLARLAALAADPVNAGLRDGALLLYRGGRKQLKLLPAKGGRPQVTLTGDTLTAWLPGGGQSDEAAVAALLKKWYREAARQTLTEKTARWAALIGVRPGRIFIREQKSRWGSCSGRGNLNYNWLIIMAPEQIIDYLVIHELCHIKIPNHSADFWRLVAQWAPDCKASRRWLKDNGRLLTRLFGPGKKATP